LTSTRVAANDIPVQLTQPENAPVGLSTFFGRQRELGPLRTLLSTERLVTITGIGGVGKTRLALEITRSAHHAFADGVWVAELASLESPRLVATAVAESVRAPYS
jgi:AAA+ ATPase superfamily predicted ATPase